MPVTPINLTARPIARETLADNKAQKLTFSKNTSKVVVKVESAQTVAVRVAHPKQVLTAGTSAITIDYFVIEPGEFQEFDVLDLADIQLPATNKGVQGGFLWISANDVAGTTFCARALTERFRP